MRATLENIDTILSKVAESYTKAIDTETTGLHWDRECFSVQIATEKGAWFFDRRIIGQAGLDKVIEFIRTAKGVLVFKNAKFDLRSMRIIPEAPVADIEVLERLINNTHFDYSLDAMAPRHGYKKFDTVKEYAKKHGIEDWSNVPLAIMEPYAVNDAIITLEIYNKLLPHLPEKSIYLFELEKLTTKATHRMELRGVGINMDYVARATNYEVVLINKLKAEFEQLHKRKYEDKKSLLISIFKAEGCTIPTTARGNASLDADALESFDSPTARIVKEIRTREKRVSTYYLNFGRLITEGRIHPDIRQAGTATGRFSYREPNFQNLPKEENADVDDKPFVVRGCIQPKPGHVLVSLDYVQQEYALLAAEANEKTLIAKMNEGLCVHTESGKMFNVSRKDAKAVNFAQVYGQGINALSQTLGITLPQTMALRNKYFSALPNIRNYIESTQAMAEKHGHVYAWSGRRFLFPDKRFAYKAVNYCIQGGCSDVVRIALTEMDKLGLPIILQIHDELVLEVPVERLDQDIETAMQIMQNAAPKKNGLRMGVKASVSEVSLAERNLKPWVKK